MENNSGNYVIFIGIGVCLCFIGIFLFIQFNKTADISASQNMPSQNMSSQNMPSNKTTAVIIYGSGAKLNLSQVAIVDINNRKITPLSIVASPHQNDGGNTGNSTPPGHKNHAIDGILRERDYPNIYHSASTTGYTSFTLVIPPTDIKYVLIYNRIGLQPIRARLEKYSLLLQNSSNPQIAKIGLSSDLKQAYRLSGGVFTLTNEQTARNSIIN